MQLMQSNAAEGMKTFLLALLKQAVHQYGCVDLGMPDLHVVLKSRLLSPGEEALTG